MTDHYAEGDREIEENHQRIEKLIDAALARVREKQKQKEEKDDSRKE